MDTIGYTPNWSRTSTSTGYEVIFCPDQGTPYKIECKGIPKLWKN